MKFLNFVIGLAIVIVLSGLFTLGVRAFYLMPKEPASVITPPPPYCSTSGGEETCAKELKTWENQWGITKAEYSSLYKKYNQEVEKYDQQIQVRNRNIFIIGNITGVLLFIAGFILTKLSARTALAVGIGTILSGLYATIVGYMTGWNGTDDRLKFFVGFVIAIIIIGCSLWVGRSRKDKSVGKDNVSIPQQPSQPPQSTQPPQPL